MENLSDLSFDELLTRKQELLGTSTSFDELSIEEMEEFQAICHILRLKARPAGKPKTVSKNKVSSDDLFDAMS